MSAGSSILIAIAICAVAAALEGVCAGKNVKSYFAKLQWPAYSAPLWVWYIIGVLYYGICFTILYRIFRHEGDSTPKRISLTLILFMMAVNAFWNYLFFRLQNLFYSFIAGILYPLVALALFICLAQFDRIAAWSVVPYLIYQIYALRWNYGLWKINSRVR